MSTTKTATAVVDEKRSREAGAELGRRLRSGLDEEAPDAAIVFASAQHDYSALLQGLAQASGARVIVGASSAGEFSDAANGQGQASALAIRSSTMRFTASIGRNVSGDPRAAAAQLAGGFAGKAASTYPYRSALVMSDALAGHADALVEELTVATGGDYRFFGGGAGDDGLFRKTHVFIGTEAVSDAVVALEVLSQRPIGVGVSHGWVPASEGYRVTDATGSRLAGLNGLPAADVIAEFATATGQAFDRADPMPFFLHNIIGIRGDAGFRLRVPLGVQEDGTLLLAADVPRDSIVHVMKTSGESAVAAAKEATRAALAALNGASPKGALVFDCVATRLRLGKGFDDELKACADLLRPTSFVGCNTYGQIARAEGQFGGFHNCTAVVCVLPD
ncbi:MAG: FIST C-terminal domain-containing protein [Myxococcales bacterium]|nr:FIST C-terminal domain-containing protein [Myxococcales bacterium]